jgi:SAM-dependent methyltransferase
MSPRRSLQAWLQERQYATPYHWHQRPNDELEYQLRTAVVLEMAEFDRRLPRRTERRLLDVGCGDARFLADAARHATAVGSDISLRALAHARRLAAGTHLVSSGGEALPFGDRTFDVVTLLDVIEHIPDEHESTVIAEAHRVLRPGGCLIVSSNTDRSACEPKHFRHYPIPRFRQLFDAFADVRLVGIIPYVTTLRFWMAVPVLSRLLRSRIRTCDPDRAQTVVGVGTKR